MKRKWYAILLILCIAILFVITIYLTLPTKEHIGMLLIEFYNPSPQNDCGEYADYWKVYYDGQVVFTRENHSEEVILSRKGQLEPRQMKKLYRLLVTTFRLYSKNINDEELSYYIIRFNNNRACKYHTFWGSIDNQSTLKKIVNIVETQTSFYSEQ